MNVKTAISLPKMQFRIIESLRKEKGLSRSAFIQGLISRWLSKQEEDTLVLRYIEGYKKKPEDFEELKALASASAQAFQAEDLK